ncbi:hypothetical protein [Klebsiella oxytoca]|nr:hypothetical protein [Klebsiella oxytoca]
MGLKLPDGAIRRPDTALFCLMALAYQAYDDGTIRQPVNNA